MNEAISGIYLDLDGRTAGPHSLDEVRQLLRSGVITDNTLYAKQGAVEWLPVRLLLAANEASPVAVPPLPSAPAIDPKNPWVCTVCGHNGKLGWKKPGTWVVTAIFWVLGLFLLPLWGAGLIFIALAIAHMV